MLRIRFLSTTLSAPIKTTSPPRLLRILPWYRQIMMPCRTATITYEETRQVTDGDGPGVGRALSACEGLFFFLCCSPAAAGSRHRSAPVGFVGNPDLLSLPLPRFCCWHPARAAYLATAVPLRATGHASHASHGPAGQGRPMSSKARGGGVRCPLTFGWLRSSDATCRYIEPTALLRVLSTSPRPPRPSYGMRVKRQAHHLWDSSTSPNGQASDVIHSLCLSAARFDH